MTDISDKKDDRNCRPMICDIFNPRKSICGFNKDFGEWKPIN
jgi:hypothetical protein